MKRWLKIKRLVARTSLLLAFLSLGNASALDAQSNLPVCNGPGAVDFVFASPAFAEDNTLFWIDSFANTVWRSRDAGSTWQEVFKFTTELQPAVIDQFQIVSHDPSVGLVLYLGVHDLYNRQYHLFSSQRAGDGWEEVTPACSGSDPDCYSFTLRAAGQAPVLFQPRLWIFGWSPLPFGIARSQDGGQSWQMVWEETDALAVAVSPDYSNDHTLWATLWSYSPTLGDDFILSHDGGETWQAVGQGLCDVNMEFADLQVSPGYTQDRTLLVGLYKNSLFQSKDGGLTWQAIFPRGSTAVCDFSLTRLAPLRPRFAPDYPDDPTIYVGTNHGLYVSYDDGQSWQQLTQSTNMLSLEVTGQARPAMSGPPAWSGSAHSPSNAAGVGNATLRQVFLPRVAAQGDPVPARPYSLFMRANVGVVGIDPPYMYRSDDGGATWACMAKPQVRRRAFLPLLLGQG